MHHVDYGGPPDGPSVVLVHGLGGSHLNWDLLAPRLTPYARVLALDLPGLRAERAHRQAVHGAQQRRGARGLRAGEWAIRRCSSWGTPWAD